MRLAHIADLHWRSLNRHQEYRQVFNEFFSKCKNFEVDGIVICGDIFHTKTQNISPEVIEQLTWFFNEAAKVSPVYVILGNHDLSIQNLSRQDAITPIVSAINNPIIHLYKKSGVYPFAPNYNFCVFSCADEDGWEKVKPVAGDVNIALFHGAVGGAQTDDGWKLASDVDVSFFDGYDVVMLGDIHLQQFLTPDKRIAYSGTCILQSFGESGDKGFLLWDITKTGKFDVSFEKLTCPDPYITIDWQGNLNKTLQEAFRFPDRSHFRIRSDVPIQQILIKHLYNELKEKKHASEIIFKIDHVANTNIVVAENTSLFKDDLRDTEIHLKLLKKFFKNHSVSKKQWENITGLVKNYVSHCIAAEEVKRNVKWSIKSLEFENLYSYGRDNKINFFNLNGITGLFAPNRMGKSAIVGALIYSLFNSSDRDLVKNLHIINTKKGDCKCKVELAIAGKDFVIERQSIRKEDKNGDHSAITNVNFWQVDNFGEKISDLNGVERGDTDKEIRKYIGNIEHFLLTSLSTQDNLRKYLDEGSTQRKSILSKFLGLDIFENIYELVKADSDDIKKELKTFSQRNWDSLLQELSEKQRNFSAEFSKLEDCLNLKRNSYNDVYVQFMNFKIDDFIPKETIVKLKNNIERCQSSISNNISKKDKLNDLLTSTKIKLDELHNERSKIDYDSLILKRENKKQLEKQINDIRFLSEKETTIHNNYIKSLKLLEEVPCGDMFPTCKFIKDSHEKKHDLSNQKQKVDELLFKVNELSKKIEEEFSLSIEKEISNFKNLEKIESELKLKISEIKNQISKIDLLIQNDQALLETKQNELIFSSKKVANEEYYEKFENFNNNLSNLKFEIESMDKKRLSLMENNGKCEKESERLQIEKQRYIEIQESWNAYELLLQATSKKGIPAQIIHSQLPAINAELSKILHGIVNFTLEFDSDPSSNAMDIYLNYGDSRRLIEAGSGMEKMVSSIAIRVALINISSLPKPDIFIIDEGFGSLDQENSQAVSQLLQSLKKWFKNIIVITHLDSIKDCVDQVLEISRENGYSKVFYE